MTFFYKLKKKTRVYYTLSISREGAGPRAPIDSPLSYPPQRCDMQPSGVARVSGARGQT